MTDLMSNPTSKSAFPVTLTDVYQARKRIRHLICHSELRHDPILSEQTGHDLWCKLETQQPVRAFKLRGAANKILSLSDDQRQRGVVTASTGNHGRAVAYVAKQLGIRAVVCLSNNVPQNKRDALARLDAEVRLCGESQDDAMVVALQLERDQGLCYVPPFDDAAVIAGQATMMLEILEDAPDVSTVIVPLSGGGLIAGITSVAKQINPNIRVIGVSMEGPAVMYHSVQAGKPVTMPEAPTLADSLLGGIGEDNQYTFALVRDYVDEIMLVSERAIADAMRYAFGQYVMLEGGAAASLAALQTGQVTNDGKTVAILSGGNVDPHTLIEIVQGTYPLP